jgi:hypothetical protein
MSCACGTNTNIEQKSSNNVSMEEYLKAREKWEDQVDYSFIQRIIQELTQSCALPLAVPASAIPPLILQAAQYFWENSDQSVEERYYCLPRNQFRKCGPNLLVKLPEQIISVFGVYKLTDSFNYGVMGDFSLERMIMNNNNMTSGIGGSITNVFNSGFGYNAVDLTASLYEISTFKSLFQAPLTYNYNAYSNELVILGDLGNSDLCLQVFKRCKIQDLYKNYQFFRYCVCLGKRALSTIYGTFEFKLPGGISINYSKFSDDANTEIDKIEEWIARNRTPDYFLNTNTI